MERLSEALARSDRWVLGSEEAALGTSRWLEPPFAFSLGDLDLLLGADLADNEPRMCLASLLEAFSLLWGDWSGCAERARCGEVDLRFGEFDLRLGDLEARRDLERPSPLLGLPDFEPLGDFDLLLGEFDLLLRRGGLGCPDAGLHTNIR